MRSFYNYDIDLIGVTLKDDILKVEFVLLLQLKAIFHIYPLYIDIINCMLILLYYFFRLKVSRTVNFGETT